MSSVPMEYWIPGSAILTVFTVGVILISPIKQFPGHGLAAVFFGYVIMWAYSPLPQGPHAPGHKRRKRKWGFEVEYESGPQTKLCEFPQKEERGQIDFPQVYLYGLATGLVVSGLVWWFA